MSEKTKPAPMKRTARNGKPSAVTKVKPSPLKPADFKQALEKIDSLDLTWTTHLPPRLAAKSNEGMEALGSQIIADIATEYPDLPVEIGALVRYALTGVEPPISLVGPQVSRTDKVKTLNDLLITPKFKDDFFFRHALKLPHLCNLDWEVVLKTGEMGVRDMPLCTYAIFSLSVHDPLNDKDTALSFATDIDGIDRLIASLSEIKDKFEQAQKVASKL